MVDDKILLAREARANKTAQMSNKSDTVTVKANVPGWEKNIDNAIITASYFAKRCEESGVYNIERMDGADGVTFFGRVDDGKKLKEKTIGLEENHPLGRFVDIDVTLKGAKSSLSRQNMRKCYLCDNPAFVCGKNKTHSLSQLLTFFNDNIKQYFNCLIENVIEESMLSELELEDKFGLVTPTSCGSHKDLNYQIMKNAIFVIKQRLKDAFFIGLKANSPKNLLEKLKPLGIECEQKMLAVTNGANAYKGFIFVGGVILASVGYVIKNGDTFDKIFDVCASICYDLDTPVNTFGYKAYKNGFGGVRKEAKSGFPAVKKAQKLLGKNSLHKVLANITKDIEDSVLLKRAGDIKKYEYFKQLIANSTENTNKEITKKCVENNISIGGSADILIAALMVDKLKKTFYFED